MGRMARERPVDPVVRYWVAAKNPGLPGRTSDQMSAANG